jgi:Heterokaryon incompatibility protein (HET)
MLTGEGDPNSSSSGMNSDKEIPVINYWLENCQKNHADCAGETSGFMPTRVVDVGSGEIEEPRLVLTAELDFDNGNLDITARRYLALSHCWGLTMPPTATTTSSTIAERLHSIPTAGLSRTFADFISLARRMLVRYVWIDSLCIIQDSREDWEKEAAQMAYVYSNSYCTVAASASADGNGGCHVDPESDPYGPVTLTFNETDSSGNATVQKVRIFSLPSKPIVNIIQQDPLTLRGWTYQERELSQRVLHFSQDSIRWECRSLKASLQFPWQDTLAFNGSLRTFDVGQISPRNPNQEITDKQKQIDQEAWFEAVLKYTGRALTKQTDILPAFSGIARTVASRRPQGDRYLAGLWSTNLFHSLCWNSGWSPASGGVFSPQNPAPIHHSRPSEEYLAPSWSWASIKGQVRYEWWLFHALDPVPSARARRFHPRILEASTTPSGPDEFGQLKAGFIRLVGKMKPALTQGEGFKRQDREGIYDVHEGKVREVGMIKYDIPTDAPVGQAKAIILLCVLPRAEKHGDCVGLALGVTGRANEYKRVGFILGISLDWFENAAEGTITIV